ncbi:Vanin-like protein 1, partial [Gryllus bimaculatus]
ACDALFPPQGAPGVGVGVGGRGLAGSADEGGYLYLKTEDLADYVTVLLPAGTPDPAAYENSSLKGEEEDYLEDDEEDEGGDDEEDDEEDEAFAPDPEEMEPTEDAFDDDEEMQMDTSAEFAIDPESVEREDMEPSETTIRAQAIADEKQAEELAEMQAHMPGVKAPDAAPDVASDAAPQEATEEAPEAAPEQAPEAAPEAAASREDQRYYYRVAVFSGRRTFDGITDGGLQVCAVIPCTGVTPDTCGKLHHFPSDLALTAFRHVRISGRFARASVRRKETDIVMETHKPVSFLTFGIYNRNFANDPERQPSIG